MTPFLNPHHLLLAISHGGSTGPCELLLGLGSGLGLLRWGGRLPGPLGWGSRLLGLLGRGGRLPGFPGQGLGSGKFDSYAYV